MAENSTGVFGNGAAGLLGLGRSSGKDSFFNAVFSEHAAWQNVTLSIALNNPNSSENPGNAGQIDLRETDPDLYEGEIKYQSVIASAGDVPTNYPADWSLHLDSWVVDTGGVRTEHTTGGVAIVEPYFPEIRFPQDQALLFCKHHSAFYLHMLTFAFFQIEMFQVLSCSMILLLARFGLYLANQRYLSMSSLAAHHSRFLLNNS
jgi:hypothetical protein